MFRRLIAVLIVVMVFSASGARAYVQETGSERVRTANATRRSVSGEQPLSVGSIDEVLWWLPPDTETVSVARGPFKAPQPSERPAPISPGDYLDRVLTAYQLGILQTVRAGRFYKGIAGSTVKFSVDGSRKFRAPTGLGSMRYEGCAITVFESGMAPSRSARINEMTQFANGVQTIAGERVMMFEEKLEEDVWKIYVAFPASNVLLCATNQEFLTQVLNRMQRKEAKRALPEDLPEWKQVNTNARFWAVRHYDRSNTLFDPSTPVSGNKRPASWADEQAVGIVLEFDPDRSKAAVTVKYLSANKDALKVFSDEHTKIGQGFKPVIRLLEPGVVEMIVPFDGKDAGGISLLVLFTLLGHSVYT